MHLKVRSGGRCDAKQFATHLVPATDGDGVVIDLSECLFVEPIALVGIAALAQRAASSGVPVRFVGPADPSKSRWMSRMRLDAVLDELGATHDLPFVAEHPQPGLLELRWFDSAREADHLEAILRGQVPAAQSDAASALHNAVAEMWINVPEHGGTRGFISAQTVPGKGHILFAVGDSGPGLLGTLGTDGPLGSAGALDEAGAIKMALSGVSGTGDPDRGGGIENALQRTVALGGSLTVLTGRRLTTDHGANSHSQPYGASFPGTLWQGSIPVQ